MFSEGSDHLTEGATRVPEVLSVHLRLQGDKSTGSTGLDRQEFIYKAKQPDLYG